MDFKTIIDKRVLLEKLRENRKRYVETRKALVEVYKEKSEEYKKAYDEYDKKLIENTLTDNEERPHPPFIPEDRTETYDMYIEMVEKHGEDTLETDSASFKSLYWDKWDFIREHIGAMTTWARGYPQVAGALAAYDR